MSRGGREVCNCSQYRDVVRPVSSSPARSRVQIPAHVDSEATISDAEFADGRRRYETYGLTSKEELLYLSALAETLDIDRVPHLRSRPYLRFPETAAAQKARLEDFLVEPEARGAAA